MSVWLQSVTNKRLPFCYRANLAALGLRVVGEVLQCFVPLCSLCASHATGYREELVAWNLRSTKGKVTKIVVV